MGRNATISRKNQITLPIAVLRQAGLKAGDRVLVEALAGGVLLIPMLPEEDEGPVTVFGRTAEEMRAYLEAERSAWPR